MPQAVPGSPGGEQGILHDYTVIRQNVLTDNFLMETTGLQLYSVNQRVLTQWYHQRGKQLELTLLKQITAATIMPMEAPDQLHPPGQLLEAALKPPVRPLVYKDPEDTAGQGIRPQSQGTGRPYLHLPQPPSAPAAPPPSAPSPATPSAVLLLLSLLTTTSLPLHPYLSHPYGSFFPPFSPPLFRPVSVPVCLPPPSQPVYVPPITARRREQKEKERREAERQGLPIKNRPNFTVRCSHCGLPSNIIYNHGRKKDRS
ncbi:uncharacterized protein LOC131961091 [Centropristis striata]|uniref:uncharacterized protein LOC131961091 n=1 Tax=Centropristis striata TaxID=184440 RepID=UPI0027E1C54F|nr:uncharacterized protein LOC131961091 [Centropristis striata]